MICCCKTYRIATQIMGNIYKIRNSYTRNSLQSSESDITHVQWKGSDTETKKSKIWNASKKNLTGNKNGYNLSNQAIIQGGITKVNG